MTSQPDPKDGPPDDLDDLLDELCGLYFAGFGTDLVRGHIHKLFALRVVPPEGGPRQPPSDGMREVDALAALIREVDGNGTMGAGVLAEKLVERGVRYAAERGVSADPPTERHVCGLRGYDPMQDPPCPACHAEALRAEALRGVPPTEGHPKMSRPRGETFCIEAPGSRHRPDPDTHGSTAFCSYCSEEIEEFSLGKWRTIPDLPSGGPTEGQT